MLYQALFPRTNSLPDSKLLFSCSKDFEHSHLCFLKVLLYFIPLVRNFSYLLGVCVLTVSQVILIKFYLSTFNKNYQESSALTGWLPQGLTSILSAASSLGFICFPQWCALLLNNPPYPIPKFHLSILSKLCTPFKDQLKSTPSKAFPSSSNLTLFSPLKVNNTQVAPCHSAPILTIDSGFWCPDQYDCMLLNGPCFIPTW